LEKSIKLISDSKYTFSEMHIIILDVAPITNVLTKVSSRRRRRGRKRPNLPITRIRI
jgi:hypothetical protein